MTQARVAVLALCGALLSGAAAAGEVGVGDKAPDVKPEKWWNSKPTSLAKLTGRVVLLEFFATW
jgi:hypothetical protein